MKRILALGLGVVFAGSLALAQDTAPAAGTEKPAAAGDTMGAGETGTKTTETTTKMDKKDATGKHAKTKKTSKTKTEKKEGND